MPRIVGNSHMQGKQLKQCGKVGRWSPGGLPGDHHETQETTRDHGVLMFEDLHKMETYCLFLYTPRALNRELWVFDNGKHCLFRFLRHVYAYKGITAFRELCSCKYMLGCMPMQWRTYVKWLGVMVVRARGYNPNNTGASIIRIIGFWGTLYHNHIKLRNPTL